MTGMIRLVLRHVAIVDRRIAMRYGLLAFALLAFECPTAFACNMFLLPGIAADDLFDEMRLYPGSVIRNRGHRGNRLNSSYANFMPHRNRTH